MADAQEIAEQVLEEQVLDVPEGDASGLVSERDARAQVTETFTDPTQVPPPFQYYNNNTWPMYVPNYTAIMPSDQLTWSEYYSSARAKFMNECMKGEEEIAQLEQEFEIFGFGCVEIATRGDNDVIASYPMFNTLLKSVFLKQPQFRRAVVDYYRQKGFKWVDIVCLNRYDWKIFLFRND